MIFRVAFFVVVCIVFTTALKLHSPLKNGGKHWALIVAGSNMYYNYRHQADVCHAFHVLKDHGVPEENIVVMMYDDIAYNAQNPDKGVIINRPGGENVYKGVKIDYKGRHVTPDVFLAVLQGKKAEVLGKGTGRVIESGPNDHIFVNFVDHGAPGLVAFPEEELHARTFMNALKSMHRHSKYAQMVIYIESCESGSMFKNLLPQNLNIYATTASNAKESSYATYMDDHLNTYVGDLYSVKWMENSDVSNLNRETLLSQYETTRRETNLSHVMEYGDMSISKKPVGDFQGNTPSARNIYYPKIPLEAVSSRDVELHLIHHMISKAQTDEERATFNAQLATYLQHEEDVMRQMKHIIAYSVNHDHRQTSLAMSERTEDINFDCYEPVAKHYSRTCRKLCKDVTAMKWMFALQNVCNIEGMSAETVISAIDKIC